MRPVAEPSLRGRKVVLVVWTLRFGGHHRQALHVAHHLAEQCGADVEVWGLSYPGAEPNLGNEVRVPCRQLQLRWRPSRLERLRTLATLGLQLRRARPSVVLSYTHVPNVACGFVSPFVGVQSWIWNQRDMLAMGFFGPRTEQQAVRRGRCFVANAEHLKTYMWQRYGIPPGRVRVVRNGVAPGPPQRGREAWRESLGVGSGGLLVSMVANLVEGKDHRTLLEAWASVLRRMDGAQREVVLALAGEGVQEHRLKALAFDLGLGRSVRFLGFVRDIPGLLSATDVAAFCSIGEGSPNGLLEAMAVGLPVVATDIEGVREAVGEAGRSALVPRGDATALADTLCSLLLDLSLRREHGSRNAARIAEEFSVGRMCLEMEELIRGELRVG